MMYTSRHLLVVQILYSLNGSNQMLGNFYRKWLKGLDLLFERTRPPFQPFWGPAPYRDLLQPNKQFFGYFLCCGLLVSHLMRLCIKYFFSIQFHHQPNFNFPLIVSIPSLAKFDFPLPVTIVV